MASPYSKGLEQPTTLFCLLWLWVRKKVQTDCRRRCVFAKDLNPWCWENLVRVPNLLEVRQGPCLGKPNPIQMKIANIFCKKAELMSSTIFPCLFCNHFLFVNTSRKNLSRSSIQKVQIQWKSNLPYRNGFAK